MNDASKEEENNLEEAEWEMAKLEQNTGSTMIEDHVVKKEHGDEVYLGAKVNYNAGISGYDGEWRVLGTDNGNLLLVSSKSIGTKELKGLDGYNNGIEELNKMCAPYGKGEGAVEARSITAEDIDELINFNPQKTFTGKPSQDGYSLRHGITTSYTATSATSHTTKSTFDYLDNYTSENNVNGFTKVDGTKLKVGETCTYTTTYYGYILSRPYNYNNTKVGDTFLEEKTKECKYVIEKAVVDMLRSEDIEHPYWLATQSQLALASGCSWGLLNVVTNENKGIVQVNRLKHLYHATQGEQTVEYDVRAVVKLDSNVKLTAVNKNSEGVAESFDIEV